MAELALVVKVTFVLAVALLAVRMTGRLSAAMRSLLLTCTFGLLVVLPAASFLLPAQAIEVPEIYSAPLASVGLTADMPPSAPPAFVESTTPASSRFAMPSMRTTILTAWAAGVVGFVVPMVVALFRLRRLHKHGRRWTPPAYSSPVDVLLTSQLRVPITYGALQPVIALPDDAPQWSESDLRRVLLHELEHVRRCDWPVHMLARTICALYWFHPLVWIAWRRLCLESERACDDAVLREEDGAAYASQLVALARRITKQDAAPLLSIAGPSHLSTRINAMLVGDLSRKPVRSAVALVITGLAVVAAVGVGPLKATTSIQRSTPQSQRPLLTFASTKIRATATPTASDGPCCQVRFSPEGRVSAVNVGLLNVIATAYGVYLWQIDKAPAWAEGNFPTAGERFDIEATTGSNTSADDMRAMLKTMLGDRFRLAVHLETRTQKVYELVLEPTGHKLLPPGPRPYRESDDIWLNVDPKGLVATLDVDQWTTAQLARHIGFPLQTMVTDRTGLTGTYRFNATWNATPGGFPGTPTIFDAFPTQLGLRLRETTGPVDYLIVDRVDRPELDRK
jgi:uncharacterized protein (TIGR03435 family)